MSFRLICRWGRAVRPSDARFDEWRRALPRPLASPAKFALKGEQIEIAVPLPDSVAIGRPYFFPADDGPVDYAAAQQFRRKGDLLIAELQRRRGQPVSLSGVLALGDGRGLEIRAVPGPVPEGGSRIGDLGAQAVLFAILGALLGGLLLNLMPCVFPILALKALHLAKAGGGERQARGDALAYAAGAVVGTGALGALLLAIRAGGSAAGWAFQLQDPRTTIILLLLVTAITLNLLRAFELPVLAGEQNPGGSFGTGALAAFVATPCAGPFLGAALGTALLLPLYGSVAVFAALGLGLAIPVSADRLRSRRKKAVAATRSVDGPAAALPRHSDGGDGGRLSVAALSPGWDGGAAAGDRSSGCPGVASAVDRPASAQRRRRWLDRVGASPCHCRCGSHPSAAPVAVGGPRPVGRSRLERGCGRQISSGG